MSKNEILNVPFGASENTWGEFLSEIQQHCLRRNFGTLSKSEFDVLLFHYYLLDKLSQSNGEYVSDYEIGKELGLTIQRVRSLRERDALKFGTKINWWKYFCAHFKYAHYDPKGDVKIPIPDVNVMKEVRNFLEQKGLYDEYQMNPKVFQCRLDALVAICLSVESKVDENCKDILEYLRSHKDRDLARATKAQENPAKAVLSAIAVKAVKGTISLIPGVGDACGELFESLVEIYK